MDVQQHNDQVKETFERVRQYLVEEAELVKRLGVRTGHTIRFPGKKVPFLAKIAIWLINRCGGKMETTVHPVTPP